jgi:hypothetical protein
MTKSRIFQIHEVYYDGKGTIHAWTESPVSPFGETLDVLHRELDLFKAALDKPVLEANDLPGTVTSPGESHT